MMPTDATPVAEELADQLRGDAADRDRENQLPVREIELLRKSGLLGLPPDDHVTGHAVTRIIAAADASIGHLFGYHYLNLWRFGLFDTAEPAARLRRDTAEQQWFWAAVSNPGDVLQAHPADGGLLINGSRAFATGAAVADRLIVNVTRGDTGARLTIAVDARAPGISYPADWDNIGQRLSASGSVVFDDVRVDAADVAGSLTPEGHDPRMIRLSLSALAYQSVLTQVYVGIAQGALAEAAEYTRNRSRPWLLSGVDTAAEDPYILAGYGELVAAVQAAGLLADHAAA
ncbi:MAG: acyl-CoA dehydrogenase family protein, partial [Pseudonocardiaceae bacterium]